MQKVYKQFSDEKLDFNQLTNLISEDHFKSKQSRVPPNWDSVSVHKLSELETEGCLNFIHCDVIVRLALDDLIISFDLRFNYFSIILKKVINLLLIVRSFRVIDRKQLKEKVSWIWKFRDLIADLIKILPTLSTSSLVDNVSIDHQH